MSAKRTTKPKWTAADRARRQAIREEYAHCPTQEELEASGDYEGPIKSGAYFAVKVLIQQLKEARRAAGLTLAVVARRTGMDEATLSRLENGRQPNPTVDTLWRYAAAVGRRLVLTSTILDSEGHSPMLTFQDIQDRLRCIIEITTPTGQVTNRIIQPVGPNSVTLVSARTGRRRTIPFRDIVNGNTSNGCIIESLQQILGIAPRAASGSCASSQQPAAT